MGEAQYWIESAQSPGVESIIRVLAEAHLYLYPDADLLGICRAAGFGIRHLPVPDLVSKRVLVFHVLPVAKQRIAGLYCGCDQQAQLGWLWG